MKDTVHQESQTRKELLQRNIGNSLSQKLRIKIMVITLFDTKGINHNDFASVGNPVLSEEYPDA
jgi:hypothetical protein